MDNLPPAQNQFRDPDVPPETPVDAGSQALAEALRSSFKIVKFVMIVLLLVFLASGFFKVEPSEQAIILRFGRAQGEGKAALLGPGLHWSFPYPIDECVKVSVSGVQQVKSTVGWYFTTAAQEAAGTEPPVAFSTPLYPTADGYALTADNNIIHTRATLSYRINDPIRYVFHFVSASNAVQNALDNALLYTASRFNVDDILTADVAGFQEAVRQRVIELVRQRDLGITVEQCPVQSVRPRQLAAAFDDVVTAEVKRTTMLSEAGGYAYQRTNQAGADAASRINLAQLERTRFVNEVAAEADRFKALLPKYTNNPSLFLQLRLNETLAEVLTNVQDKIFLPEGADGNPKELRLLLNREPPKLKTEESKP